MGPKKSLSSWHGRRASKRLWQEGVLFHNFLRFPAKLHEENQGNYLLPDRLLGILRRGLMAPAHCNDGSVVPDLSTAVSDSHIAYGSVIFLHRYREKESFMYGLLGMDGEEDENVMVVIDKAVSVMQPAEMGSGWPVLCADEVYSTEPIDPANFRAVYMPQRYLQETAVRAALEHHDMPVFTY